MPQLLSALLLASSAAASLTTSFWMPMAYDDEGAPEYSASVIGVKNDRTTLAMYMEVEPDTELGLTETRMTATATVGPSFFEAATITSVPESTGDYTANLKCSATASSEGECTYSWNGVLAHDVMCEEATQGFDDFLSTAVEAIVPDWCSTDSLLPESIAIQTYDSEGTMVAVVITAGEDKLSATAGGSVTTSSAQATGTSAGSSGPAPTTGNPTAASGASGSASPEETGAAAAIAVPALAGLGAALMQFVL